MSDADGLGFRDIVKIPEIRDAMLLLTVPETMPLLSRTGEVPDL